ncbi:MAG: asparagine synthase (glutamine-hydrolyzing) [bacterium]
MCGIAGVYHFGERRDLFPGVVGAMTERMVARGPDDSGVWRDSTIELGHRRLAIVDLTEAGRQPMVSACERWVLCFNGEIYNHEDLAREVGLDRTAFRSTSDTEVLLEGWARLGADILPRLVGQFAFALYDRRERRLWLVRDRFGEKPLFHHGDATRLTFASSIEALLAAPWVSRELDREAARELVALRYVVSPRTVLRDVRKVPPGHLLRIDRGGVARERWYEIPARAERPRPLHEEDVERFNELLRSAVRRCRVSDVPVALFLSDGIDSRAIAAAGGGDLPSFSYRAHQGSVADDASYPEGHTFLDVSNEERLRDLDAAFAALTEPVGDGVALATWQLVRLTRDRAPVFLCGHGGDEVLGGYRLNRDLLTFRSMHALRALPAKVMRKIYGRALGEDGNVAEALRRVRAGSRAEVPAATRYLINRPLPVDDLRQLFGAGGRGESWEPGVDRLYDECADGATALDRIQSVMLHTFLTENLCSFADAAAMASSAEIRMPFLDRDLVDFVLTLPVSHRVGGSLRRTDTKRILRRWAHGRLPEDVIRRKKRGFASGRITHLLEADATGIRSRILGVPELREAMPGLEGWLARDVGEFRGAREGTYWALLALGVWFEWLGRERFRGSEVPTS